MPLNVCGSSSPLKAVQRIKARVQAKTLEENIKRLHQGGYCDDGGGTPWSHGEESLIEVTGGWCGEQAEVGCNRAFWVPWYTRNWDDWHVSHYLCNLRPLFVDFPTPSSRVPVAWWGQRGRGKIYCHQLLNEWEWQDWLTTRSIEGKVAVLALLPNCNEEQFTITNTIKETIVTVRLLHSRDSC